MKTKIINYAKEGLLYLTMVAVMLMVRIILWIETRQNNDINGYMPDDTDVDI